MHYNFDFKNVYDNYFYHSRNYFIKEAAFGLIYDIGKCTKYIKLAAFGEIYRFGQNNFELLSQI